MYLSLRPPSWSPGGQGINIDLDTMVKPWYDRRKKKRHGMTVERKNPGSQSGVGDYYSPFLIRSINSLTEGMPLRYNGSVAKR